MNEQDQAKMEKANPFDPKKYRIESDARIEEECRRIGFVYGYTAAKKDDAETIAEVKNKLESHGPEGHNVTNAQYLEIRAERDRYLVLLKGVADGIRDELPKSAELIDNLTIDTPEDAP